MGFADYSKDQELLEASFTLPQRTKQNAEPLLSTCR